MVYAYSNTRLFFMLLLLLLLRFLMLFLMLTTVLFLMLTTESATQLNQHFKSYKNAFDYNAAETNQTKTHSTTMLRYTLSESPTPMAPKPTCLQ